MKNKILLTGGHAGSTALAVIEELEKNPNLEIFWIGSAKAVEGQATKTLESKLIPDKKITYFEIKMGRLQKKFTRHTLLSLAKVPVGFFQAFSLVNKIRPNVVLAFGGSVSVPVVVSAWILRTPIVVHEQTIAAGLANKISSFFASKIAISRIESKKFYGNSKTVLTGNPVNKKFLKLKRKPVKNLIYITGGSRGSQIINELIFDLVPTLTQTYHVIHQTGELDYEKALKLKSKKYEPHDFLNPSQIADIYEAASLVIARSGANTVSELAILGIPTIFIPIPWTRYDEQTKNAQMAVSIGFAKILPQSDLNRKNLLNLINKLINKQPVINNEEYQKVKIDLEASKNITQVLRAYLK